MTPVRSNEQKRGIHERARKDMLKPENESILRSRCVWVSRAVSVKEGESYRYFFVLAGTTMFGTTEKDIANTVEKSDKVKLMSMKAIDDYTRENILEEPIYILDIRGEELLMLGISDKELETLNPWMRDFVDTQIALDELDKNLPTSRKVSQA